MWVRRTIFVKNNPANNFSLVFAIKVLAQDTVVRITVDFNNASDIVVGTTGINKIPAEQRTDLSTVSIPALFLAKDADTSPVALYQIKAGQV